MPTLGFKCRICLQHFPLAEILDWGEGLDHFESAHGENYCIDCDSLYTLALLEDQSNKSPRRQGSHYTASMAGGCHREHALKRTVDVWLDPFRSYSRLRGTLAHEALKVPVSWDREVELPETLVGKIKVSGIADRIDYVKKVVRDLKTHNCPSWKWVYPASEEKAAGKKPKKVYDRKFYPPGEGEILQLNILMRLVELANNSPEPYRGEIVAKYMGVGDNSLANRILPVPRLSDDELEARILPRYEQFTTVMSEPNIPTRLKMIGEMELEGLKMYNSRDGSCKCVYCDVKDDCDRLRPENERF